MNETEHPLFPAKEDDDEPPLIGSISICRFDPVKGTSPFIPRRFSAEEIRDLSQIAELYGGGRYELIGRNTEGNRIVAKRVYEIAGESKPLVAPLPMPDAPPPVRASQQPAQPASPFAGLAPLLPVIVPVVLQYMQTAAADRMAQQQRMQEASQSSQQQMQAMMMAMMQQQQSSSQAFIQAMSSLPHKGSGSSEEFRAGIAFAENLIQGKLDAAAEAGGGETEAAEIMKTIGQAFEMLKLTGNGPPATGGGT